MHNRERGGRFALGTFKSYKKPLRLDLLREHRFDFMKMEGEGCEEELTRISKLHSPQLTEALTKRFTERVVTKLTQTVPLLYSPNEPSPN